MIVFVLVVIFAVSVAWATLTGLVVFVVVACVESWWRPVPISEQFRPRR
jgi:hypothetical protein